MISHILDRDQAHKTYLAGNGQTGDEQKPVLAIPAPGGGQASGAASV
jgi:hypothetical protein